VKITGIDTITLADVPWLIFVRVRGEDGIVGYGDTYYASEALRSYIHAWMAPRLLGRDALQIERIWSAFYDRDAARWGGLCLEMRALSAIDVALWDILGQVAGLPIYQLLGGACRDRVRVYNTCGGPLYGRPGAGQSGSAAALKSGEDALDDLQAFLTDAGRLAESLLAEGIRAMKIWPLDRFALANEGHWITADELGKGLEPLAMIRRAVGDDMEIMLEGHGYWDLPTAVRIARAAEEFRPAWLEDMILAHDISALRRLRESTVIPILASEYLITKRQFRPLLEQEAADIVMLDPTWTGGITESRKIAALADTYSLPVTMHDCTGPFTLLAGIHLAFSNPNAIYQEVVRAYLRTWYRDCITEQPRLEDGHLLPPIGAGIGSALLPDLLERPGVTVVSSDA